MGLTGSNRPKKLLYIGIILISFSILFFIIDRFITYYFGLLGYIVTLPPLVIGIILLRKYSRTSKLQKKLLYIGIILISFSILFFIGSFDYYFGVLEGYIVGLLLLVIGIILLRKYSRTSKLQKKLVSSKPQQPPKQQHDAGKTQFWVCPVCGNDMKEYHGKSYCNHCERYF